MRTTSLPYLAVHSAPHEDMKPLRILETCLYVDDLEAAERFYRHVLGLEVAGRQAGRHVFFRCGTGMLLLFNPQASSEASSTMPPHGSRGPGHVAFAADEGEMEAWRERLQAHGVAIERVVRWPYGGTSLYFRDPAGNSLEIAPSGLWDTSQSPGRSA